MRRAYYTQNTSDYRTVSKKTRSSQKERKLKMITIHTRPPERAHYFKDGFNDYRGPYIVKMTFRYSC